MQGGSPLSDLIPFILGEEKKQIKTEVAGLPVAVIFDGTSRLGEVLAIILWFVDRCTEVWMTILESGWNLWVWLVGVVSRRWVWLVGGIYGYGYNV